MVKIQEILSIIEDIETVLPKDFPNISAPLQNKDLLTVYNYFNKKYFSGALPSNIRLKFVALTKNFFGKTHVKFGDGKIKDLLITIGDTIKNAPNKTVNVLLHEMIHVWQYVMFVKTGDRAYVDDTFSVFASADVNTRGHGETFHKWVNKLNALGYKIEVASGMMVNTELTKPVYGIVFDVDKDRSVLLVSKDNPEKHIDSIIGQVESKMGVGFFTEYVIFKSKDSQIVQGIRLTKNMLLPKNSVHIQFSKKWVDSVMNSPLSSGHKRVKSEPTKKAVDVPNSIVQLLPTIHKYRKESFLTYLKTALFNSEDFSYLYKTSGVRIDGEPNPEYGITAEIIDYIKKDWSEITDVEIKRCNDFKYSLNKIKQLISGRMSVADAVKDLINGYEKNYKDRVDFKRFKKIWFSFLITKLKKEGKKYPRYLEYTTEEALSGLLKGSIFEGKKANNFLIFLNG